MSTPKQWHIYTVDLEPRVGTKPGKQRPCLCVQPTEFCENGLASTVLIPLTTNTITADSFPLRIKVSKGICGLLKDSELLINQVLAWDISLIKDDLGKIPDGLQELVQRALWDSLDL